MLWILLIVLLIVAIAGAPGFGPIINHPYGWGPSGTLGLIAIILLIWLLLGQP